MSGGPPQLTAANVRLLRRGMAASSAKACRELGWTPGDWRGAVRKAVRWFLERAVGGAELPGPAALPSPSPLS